MEEYLEPLTSIGHEAIIKYVNIARELIHSMNIRDKIVLHITRILLIAAFVYRRSLRSYRIVIGNLILEFPEE